MFVILYYTLYSSRSPNPLRIYHKVFIELATEYSKRVLNQSHTARYPKQQKRSLSNRENWGKRSDTMSKEVEDLKSKQQLDNEIFSKRIWLEEKKPEKDSDIQEILKDDVTSSRLSPIRKLDLNRIRFLHNHGSLFDLFPPVDNDNLVCICFILSIRYCRKRRLN